jgi:hypothetical protein
MPTGRKGAIEFAAFLSYVNIAIAAATLIVFFFRGPNEYVGPYTICLSMAFAAQNNFFILSVRRRFNPLLMLVIIHALAFYELRVLTLLWNSWSVPFMNNAFGPVDLNMGLLYIMAANFVMFLGLSAHADKGFEAAPAPGSGGVSVSLLIPVLIFSLGIILNFDCRLFSGLRGYFGIIFNPEIVLLLSLVLVFLYHDALSKRQKILISGIIFVFVAYRTATGSRSALLILFFFAFSAWSAARGPVILARKMYLMLAAVVPVAAALFIAGTYVRKALQATLGTILDRMGFLDMSTELIFSSRHYRSVINFSHYAKSVIDNGLTPGFNVFDAPKAANILSFIYDGTPGVSLKTVALKSYYHSDMFTVYGEAYVLFGAAAGLLAIFTGAYLFQKLYRLSSGPDPFRQAVLKSVILVVFHTYFLGSFGVDWFVVDMIRSAVPFMLMLYLFSVYVRRRSVPLSGGPVQ